MYVVINDTVSGTRIDINKVEGLHNNVDKLLTGDKAIDAGRKASGE